MRYVRRPASAQPLPQQQAARRNENTQSNMLQRSHHTGSKGNTVVDSAGKRKRGVMPLVQEVPVPKARMI